MIKKTNLILLAIFLIAFAMGILGTIVKVISGNAPDILFLMSLTLSPLSLLGLLVVNLKRISRALFH